ncbi:MAG TPA: helix-turn-helix transcriptional regulator [Usitatibacter sp.]|nr:helix-turn-helix transcriptional regulator [Usitatibacter sp.]
MDPKASEPPPGAALLNVRELAGWLRLKERKVYDLVSRGEIPHTRVGAKILFTPAEVERWLAGRAAGAGARPAAPPTIAGSHDPLLEWAVRESRCGLALLTQGSRDGLERLAAGEACAALLHLPHADLGDFNREPADAMLRGHDVALVEWARREQGLLVARGNPKKLAAVGHLARRGVRVVLRQPGSGSRELLERLLERERVKPASLAAARETASTESDLASAIAAGEADAGFGARAAARLFNLDFVPLAVERLDLAVSRPRWFDSPLQALWRFARSRRFAAHAQSLTGYDLAHAGEVTWNDQA